jgi:predicted amidohydrolase YtcJ
MTHADEIWIGGDILTMDPSIPRASALAIRDGRLIAVGADSDILNLCGPGTRRRDLHGRFVMPGLVESHTHALWGACRELFDVYVGYGASFAQLMDATRARAAQLAPGDVVHGGPWRHEMRAAMGSNPRALLDAISDRHPILLLDASQHIVWCNSLALDLAGIGPDAPDVPGGVVERDPATGQPNGILAESAGAPVRALLRRSEAQLADAARFFIRDFNTMGFTAFKEPMALEEEMRTYHAADQRGEMTLHAATHIVRSSPMGDLPVPYDAMERLRRDYASENVHTDFAKLFLDGVAAGYTASFIDPYRADTGYDAANHDPDATLLLQPETLNETVTELDRRGFTVKMHAVGDNAIRKGLDAIEAARKANGMSGLRHEIAHGNYISDADVPRFRALDAVAEMSPKMWYPNPATVTQMTLVGPERLAKSHRIKDLLAAGANVTYASDWPAAAPDANPWTGLSGMLTRRNADPAYPGELAPDQAITLDQALPIFTRNGARSLRLEDQTGALEAGKWADFIVLDRALDAIPAEEIAAVAPVTTVWKGRRVHDS